jgi:predicted nucleotidyltransferase component of viral defense system
MKKESTQSFVDNIKNLSEKTGTDRLILQRLYMMECFLDRLSRSPYKDQFILKGGVLIAAIFGTKLRSTMDIDQTIKGFDLTEEKTKEIIAEIIRIPADDGVVFSLASVAPIQENADYPGLRIHLDATLDQTVIPVLIDLSTGDAITPKEIEYSYPRLFGGSIPLCSYPIETVVAEKLETVLSRGEANTRMRDFYDIALFYKQRKTLPINRPDLVDAFAATLKKRGTEWIFEQHWDIVTQISYSPTLKKRWAAFQKNYAYAQTVDWSHVVMGITHMLEWAM